jgi:hypothetical protein
LQFLLALQTLMLRWCYGSHGFRDDGHKCVGTGTLIASRCVLIAADKLCMMVDDNCYWFGLGRSDDLNC